MKKYATTLILALTIFIGELHTFWERSSYEAVNWIWKRSTPMALQWNIKFVALQVNYVLWFIAAYYYGKYPNRGNKTTVITFIWLAVLDMGMYFYNYKTQYFGSVYLWLVVIWLLTYYWKNIWQYLWKGIKNVFK
jgi:hypothetical protein